MGSMSAGGLDAVTDFDADIFDELINIELKHPGISSQISDTLNQLIS